MKKTLQATGMASILLFFVLSGCRTSSSKSVEKATDTSRLVKEGVIAVSWPCSGMGREFPSGKNAQEDYCEWNRFPEKFVGRQVSSDGKVVPVSMAKACIFNSTFDRSRRYFLSQRTSGVNFSKNSPFYGTRSNTFEFLAGSGNSNEPASNGLLQRCLSNYPCAGDKEYCNEQRASDSQICRVLNGLGKRQCKLDLGFTVAPTITARASAKSFGDQAVKPQLSIRSSLVDKCRFVEDPAIKSNLTNSKNQSYSAAEQASLVACDVSEERVKSCDEFASDISVSLTLKVENPQCAGGGSAQSGLSIGADCKLKRITPILANPRKDSKVLGSTSSGSDLRIRAFVGDYVSATLSKNVELASLESNQPVFVLRNHVDSASCKVN